MRLRKNRRTERAGVNETRAFFEACDCVFQEVDLGNDYGKDAYVDLVDGQEVTGHCVALQIKSGASFRTARGYAIPVEGHEEVWRMSSLPVAGIVYDRYSRGRVHPVWIYGGLAIVISQAARLVISATATWASFVHWMVG